MALFKYFKPISKSCKKCDELELPDAKDVKIQKNLVLDINKVAKKHVRAVSHGPLSRGPYLKISSTEKAVVCRYASEHGVASACMSTL